MIAFHSQVTVHQVSCSFLHVDVDDQVDMSHQEEETCFTFPRADSGSQSEYEIIQRLRFEIQCISMCCVVFNDLMVFSDCRKGTRIFLQRRRRCRLSGRVAFMF